ncbi:MAG: hypothetical protein HY843_01090 [Bdellovibrio sp.]|nr:hypothetical protein [Bdellovibrio sp.]
MSIQEFFNRKSHLASKLLLLCIVSLFICDVKIIIAGDLPLDQSLKPEQVFGNTQEDISGVFRDMGIVQRKAMNKAKKTLVSTYVGMDFSDGPYSMYGVNMNLGYALSDFFEVYFNFVPAFINSKRSIVDKVGTLTLLNGEKASITMGLAKLQYGAELLWAPLYGKDSLGTRAIVRSDTFIKLGFMLIQYDIGQGMKFHLGVGKTYFISKWLGFRVAASTNYVQTIVDNVKSFNPALVFELGIIGYLF